MSSKKNSVEEKLLIISSKSFARPLLQTVTDDNNEILCGWRDARPCPEYKLTSRSTKKHKKQTTTTTTSRNGSTTTLPSVTRLHQKNYVMNGKLTKEYDYIYEGKLNDKASSTTVRKKDAAELILSPVMLNKSDSMSNSARKNIQRLAQLQLRPDIAYEQLIIDEKLKTINLNSMCEFHNIKGLFNHPTESHVKSSKDASKKSRNPQRLRPRARPLDWAQLKGHDPAFKNDLTKCKPMLKSSFSRLLESSSVIYSYKK